LETIEELSAKAIRLGIRVDDDFVSNGAFIKQF
jgi:hypothetical protein